jgi:hypothetical protein
MQVVHPQLSGVIKEVWLKIPRFRFTGTNIAILIFADFSIFTRFPAV